MSDVDIDELAKRLGDVPLVDVRTPEEYDGSNGKAARVGPLAKPLPAPAS